MHSVERLKTGIAVLDDVLHGGLIPERLYLVDGNPGSGKTTFALQFLLEGVRQGEKCLYVTLSETREELEASAAASSAAPVLCWSGRPVAASQHWRCNTRARRRTAVTM